MHQMQPIIMLTEYGRHKPTCYPYTLTGKNSRQTGFRRFSRSTMSPDFLHSSMENPYDNFNTCSNSKC